LPCAGFNNGVLHIVQGKWKVLIGVVGVAVIAGGVAASIRYSRRDIVTVQTGKVIQEDLASVVTASGTINPKTYINIGAQYQGQITDIYVKEGDHVRKGQLLAKVDSAQSAADVVAQQAGLSSAQADANAAEEAIKAGQDNIRTLEATLNRTKADLTRYEADFKRGEDLFKAGLIPKSDYDQRVAAYNGQKAAIAEDEARITQAKAQAAQQNAQYMSAQKKVAQSQAGLNRTEDILKKHDTVAPIDGLVTYLPVRVGETVVPGVQNSAASTIMTIADMSVVTAEVMVDESDIVNIKVGQSAEITVDAIPNKTFTGHVTDIGNTAILRSTGLAASTSNTSSQEAKDFKVVVAMDNPPDEIRPGLSCSAKITTATRKGATAIPIQALTTRTKGDLIPEAQKPVNPDPATAKANKEEYTGVFIVNGQKAEFRKVATGITGATETEVLSGLNPGDQIITGSYQTIRTIKNGAQIKIDNTPPGKKQS
jgi:HlyD family secretion protein